MGESNREHRMRVKTMGSFQYSNEWVRIGLEGTVDTEGNLSAPARRAGWLISMKVWTWAVFNMT